MLFFVAAGPSEQAGVIVLAVRANPGQYFLRISVVHHSAKVPHVIINWGEGSCSAGRELLPP